MKLKISPLVAVMGVYFALSGKIFLFISYLTALALHELAHANKAARLGYVMNETRLTPFGAALCGNFDGMSPSDEIKIAIAGPAFNLFTGLVFTGLWWTFPELYFFTRDFATANFALAAYNLVPAYPLDGGRISFALMRRKIKSAHKIQSALGFAFCALFCVIFAFSLKGEPNPTLLLAAAFTFTGAAAPGKNLVYRRLYDKLYRSEKFARGLPVKIFAVAKNTTVKRLKKLMSPDYYSVFRIAGERVTVTESDFDYTEPRLDELPVCRTEQYKKRYSSKETDF